MSDERAAALRAPDVVGLAGAAAILNVNRARMYVLASRPDFPPARELVGGKVYSTVHIRAFRLERELKQPVMCALAAYEQHPTIAGAARAADVDPATARRWLRRLGVALPSER